MDTIWKDQKNEYTAPSRDSLTMLTYSLSKISTNYLGINKTDDCIFSNSRLEDSWELETIGMKDFSTTADDDKALSEFSKSIQLTTDINKDKFYRKD